MAEAALAGPVAAPRAGRLDGVVRLAERLRREGRAQEAVVLYEHLLELAPADPQLGAALADALGAAGRTLEALQRLMAMKAQSSDPEGLMAQVRAHSAAAAEKFNAHVQAGQVEEAERYASALAALVPASEPMLNAAMSCNLALGRQAEAERYARALLQINPAHQAARAALARAPTDAAPDAAAEIDRQVEELVAGKEPVHPLVRLTELHGLSSRLLCAPLDEAGVGRVQRLLAAAATLQVRSEPGSEWAGWEKHYRLLLQAVDLPAVLAPTPEAAPEPKLQHLASTGKTLTARQVRAAADRLGARVVFFAAADISYVELYARWYALSVLKHCDVPFLIVIHVIGGAGRLKEIAAKVGISDERLVYAADGFDAGTVTTRCYDAPPKGLAARPIAHFQCVRFQRLGALLGLVERPVFVSDIDLLLQRGVADLLDRHAAEDVVFNQNELSWNAGSRLTANLVLVRPTANAHILLRFLRAYLDRVLAGEEVTRWIDQAALLLARHHLQHRGDNPRIGYFDTASDINNVMYPSYQANPFRFLSLYHGFDTSSLEGMA